MTTFPQEHLEILFATDFKAITPKSKKHFEIEGIILNNHRPAINQILTWLKGNDCPENWLSTYIDYIAVLLGASYFKKGRNNDDCILWPGIYDLKNHLGSWFTNCIKNSPEKSKYIIAFSKQLRKMVENYRYPSYLMSHIISIYCKRWRTGIQLWQLNTEEEINAGHYFLSTFLDLCIDCFENFEDKIGFEELHSSLFYLERTIEKFDPSIANELKARVMYVMLIGFNPKSALMSIGNLIEEVCQKEQVEINEIASRTDLTSKGKELFDTNRKQAILYLLLNYLLQGLETVQIENLKDYMNRGGNISNVPGIYPIEGCLEHLSYFVNQAELIGTYLGQYIQSSDDCYIIAKAMDNYLPFIFSHKEKFENGKVVKAIFKHISNGNYQEEGQIEVNRLLILWNLAPKQIIPEIHQIKVPTHLARNIKELKELFLSLKLEKHVPLNKPTQMIPDYWPEEVKNVYLWTDGSDIRAFQAISSHPKLLRDILNTVNADKKDEAEMEDEDFSFPRVNILNHVHEAVIPVGTNHSGDMYFIEAINGSTRVIKYCHDELLTGIVEANSLSEFLSKVFIRKCIEIHGYNEELEAFIED